jgi:uncharacterized membrane protein YfcA
MSADVTFVAVLVVLFVASFVRSALGFGEALIAVPLLALAMPVEVAAPVAVLLSITVAVLVLATDWREVQFGSARRLVLATLVGTPLGLALLIAVPGALVKGLLAALIIAFSSWSLIRRASPARLHDDRLAWLFGFGAGVLGGAYGMNGPPLVVYGSLRRWSPQQFRATQQGYFLPASTLAMAGYALTGLWTPEVTRYYLFALPAVVAAVVLGRAVNRRLAGPAFLAVVHVVLIATGVALLWQAWR